VGGPYGDEGTKCMETKTVGERLVLAIGVILLSAMLVSCGWIGDDVAKKLLPPWDGDGGNQQPHGPYLWWTPPTSYADGSPLDAATEIWKYEIAISVNNTISEENIVGYVEGGTEDRYDLALLKSGLSQWVTVRCIAMNNLPSDFAPPVLWGPE